MRKITIILLLGIIILAAFLRLYKISTNPPGLYWDEASIGYNAYSILQTGKDEHGEFLPLAFKSFGEYKLPVYIYLAALSESIFGPTEFAVRLPSALAGILTVFLLFSLVSTLFSNRNLALLSSLFLAISPWHIHFSRAAFEANLALFFLTLGVVCFLVARKRYFLLFLSSLSFTLTLYTYSTARLFTPLLLFFLIFVYRKDFRLKKSLWIFSSLLFFIVFYLFILISPGAFTRFNSINALQGYSPLDWPLAYIKNYLQYFSFDFLFFRGDQIARHGVEKMGNLYFFSIPLLLIGFFQLLKLPQRKPKLILFSWLFLAPMAAAFTNPSPHSLRSLNIIIPLEIISAFGLWVIIKWLKTFLKSSLLFIPSYGLIMLTITYFFLSYLHLYFSHYPKTASLAWQGGNKEMAQSVLHQENNFDKILISDSLEQTYIYLLFYGRINPEAYQKSRTNVGFGKYYFLKDTWPPKNSAKTLWALSFREKFKPDAKFVKSIKIPNGDTVYQLWEKE